MLHSRSGSGVIRCFPQVRLYLFSILTPDKRGCDAMRWRTRLGAEADARRGRRRTAAPSPRPTRVGAAELEDRVKHEAVQLDDALPHGDVHGRPQQRCAAGSAAVSTALYCIACAWSASVRRICSICSCGIAARRASGSTRLEATSAIGMRIDALGCHAPQCHGHCSACARRHSPEIRRQEASVAKPSAGNPGGF